MAKENKKENINIRVSTETKNTLKMLSTTVGKTDTKYLIKAIDFLSKTGIDVFGEPRSNVAEMIKKTENRIIGFLKKREEVFFNPMVKKFEKNSIVIDTFFSEEKDIEELKRQVKIGMLNELVDVYTPNKENPEELKVKLYEFMVKKRDEIEETKNKLNQKKQNKMHVKNILFVY